MSTATQIQREAPDIEARKLGLIDTAKALTEKGYTLPDYVLAGLTPEQKSNNRKISDKKGELENRKDNLEIEQTLVEDVSKKENIQDEISKVESEIENLDNQVEVAKDNNLDKDVYTEEEINTIIETSNDSLAFLNDENFDEDFSPIELTEEDIFRMSQDLLRIEGVNPTHQTELVNYLY